MYMDSMKLFTKNKKELRTLLQAVRIYNQDIGMEFGFEKCEWNSGYGHHQTSGDERKK